MPYADPDQSRTYQREYRRLHRAGECTTPGTTRLPGEFRLQRATDVLDLIAEQIEAVRAEADAGTLEKARCIGYLSGIALKAIEAGDMAMLRELYRQWPVFRLAIDDTEAQLARTDLAIAARYAELASVPLRGYLPQLEAEFGRCREAVLGIKEETELLDGDATQQRAIQLRNPYVDPMNLMQVDLLRRWRATAREDADLFQALLASVSGIAQGLQTTG